MPARVKVKRPNAKLPAEKDQQPSTKAVSTKATIQIPVAGVLAELLKIVPTEPAKKAERSPLIPVKTAVGSGLSRSMKPA